jgi:crotonobetainyl-CoA:carnitine CoA-transferase CaiB-like acyl-CoA transferase
VNGPLDGVRVVDVTSNVAGPFGTHILAALGAEVIKIERPDSGDDTRGWGPPFWNGVGMTFLDLNRRKRSVALDLKREADRNRLFDMTEGADVFIQNLRPGSLRRIGLGPEELVERFPRLIYCEISGFGFTGPLSENAAFDPLMQAFTGLMSITGHDDSDPARIPVSMLDKGAGMWAVIGILAGLRERETSGKGSIVRTSLLETAFGFQAVQAMGYIATGAIPKRLGSGTVGIAPYEAFPTRDSHVVIAAGNDRLFQALCAALGAPEIASHSDFTSNSMRFSVRTRLREVLSAYTSKLSTDELMARLVEHGVPGSPVNSVQDAVDSEQVRAMQLFQRVDGMPEDVRAMRLPVTFDGDLVSPATAPPELGADTDSLASQLKKKVVD